MLELLLDVTISAFTVPAEEIHKIQVNNIIKVDIFLLLNI
jgi:hypothetical protein